LRRKDREEEESKNKLIVEAEKLADYAKFEIAQNFNAVTYVGRWMEIDGKSTLEIEYTGSWYKITSMVNEKTLFCYSDTVSEINKMEFSIDDKPPDGSAFILLFHNVEIKFVAHPDRFDLAALRVQPKVGDVSVSIVGSASWRAPPSKDSSV